MDFAPDLFEHLNFLFREYKSLVKPEKAKSNDMGAFFGALEDFDSRLDPTSRLVFRYGFIDPVARNKYDLARKCKMSTEKLAMYRENLHQELIDYLEEVYPFFDGNKCQSALYIKPKKEDK